MINEINLITLSNETLQSDFPGLYNTNVNNTKLKIDEIIAVIGQDAIEVANISGGLQSNIDSLETDVAGISGYLQDQIGSVPAIYSTITSTVSVSAGLQSQIDSFETNGVPLPKYDFICSTPPTDSELDTNIGQPNVMGEGFSCLLDANNNATNLYLVSSVSNSWWITEMTKVV